jgi:hypothetical protein
MYLAILMGMITMLNLTPGLDEIKQRFDLAAKNSTEARSLFKVLSDMNLQPDQRIYAWWGATETLLAKDALLPTTKLSLLDKGMEKINASLKRFPDDPEIVLLRFTVQSQVPSFVGRSGNLEADKQFLMKKMKQLYQAGDCRFLGYLAPRMKYTGALNKQDQTLLDTWMHNCNRK